MNLRYRVLTIENEIYILDMGGASFWRIIFPLLYWILPLNAYKVSDHALIEKIVSPNTEQKSVGWQSVLGGVVALGLGNLLRPLVDYFVVDTSTFINGILLSFVTLLIFSFLFYVNVRGERKIKQVIHPSEYPKKKLWIRPQSSKNIFQLFFLYLFFLGLSILFAATFIQTSNGFVLFGVTLVLCMTLLLNVLAIQDGEATVRFKANE